MFKVVRGSAPAGSARAAEVGRETRSNRAFGLHDKALTNVENSELSWVTTPTGRTRNLGDSSTLT